MKFAQRLQRLGTETAFLVGAEAAEWAAQGNKVYPFHLGDMNLKTPQNIIDAAVKAMNAGKTNYCPPAGIKELRAAVAESIGTERNMALTFENVSVQPGGKPIIGKFLMALMDPGDEVLYPNPGYPIYESQINFLGGVGKAYGFKENGAGFVLDMDAIRRLITPKTKILIYNNYQNPTGATSSDTEMAEIAELAKKHDLLVLSDEAYFDVLYDEKGKSIAALPGMAERTVILYTFAKKYAMTGWRLGAAIGPKPIIDCISKLNVNDESCTNHFTQWAAIEALKGSQEEHHKIVGILRKRRDVCVAALNRIPGVKVAMPQSTFYLFPNVTGVMQMLGLTDVEDFRKLILKHTGVSFCTRKHFGTPLPGEKEHYIRLAYSGIDAGMIEEGLGKMKKFVESRTA
jgi:aspartate/methionine/tyrosine aminotransferase